METIVFDGVHCALQDGAVSTEVWLFFEACRVKLGITAKSVETFLKSDWQFPAAHKAKGRCLWRIFDEFRTRSSQEASKLKASASELLGVVGLLRHFADVHCAGRAEVASEYVSLMAAFDVVDLFLCAKQRRIDTQEAGTRLYRAVSFHMEKHKECYGCDHIKPKFYWLFDCCRQVATHPMVLDCFVVERLHLRVKHVANSTKNITSYERSVLAGILNTQIDALANKTFADGLRGKVLPYPGLWAYALRTSWSTSRRISLLGTLCSAKAVQGN